MTPERWKQISRIYDAARARPAGERGGFLASACGSDLPLLREVQSLLDQPTSPEALEGLTPAAVVGALGDHIVSELTGRRFGVYVVAEKIGAGGMGEVYRARDTRLGRDVAIKVLPPAFANDPERRARFEREARVLASLDHPHIGTIIGVEESEGILALVLGFVEGETLADRIVRGPLPVVKALEYARQISMALEAAHDKGIVHRDLKPANIRITTAGILKVLDFGLAKADALASSDAAETEAAHPTGSGIVVGTLAYMSPEQARGYALDKRTDIWAFGCVLYEMLTGRDAFAGDTSSDTLARILEREPDLRALPAATPANVVRLLTRCFKKDPRERLGDIGDARREIELSQRARPYQWLLRPKVAIPAVALIVAASFAAILYLRRPPALSQHDTILLADIANATGDPLFEGILTQALLVKLEESPFLNVVTEDRVRETLRLMGRPRDEKVTAAIGREVCQRQGLKAMVSGTIAGLGARYLITLSAINCQNGDALARAQAEAANKDEVIRALGRATQSLRRTLGESLATAQRFDAPLEEATTSSLEALKSFTAGKALVASQRNREAIPNLKRAIELDPGFAYAYNFLSIAYFNQGEAGVSAEYLKQAYERRARVTERERLAIAVQYHMGVTGDLAQQSEALALVRQTYPQEADPLLILGGRHALVGQYAQAVDAYREAVRLRPDITTFWIALANAYIESDRLDEAKALLGQLVAQKRDPPRAHWQLWRIAVLRSDREAADHELQWQVQRDSRDALVIRAQIARMEGRFREHRAFMAKLVDVDTRAGLHEAAALTWSNLAGIEALVGRREDARRAVTTALETAPMSRRVKWNVASALAIAGFTKDAHPLLEQTIKSYPPTDTMAMAVYIPQIRAAISLTSGRPAEAIELLQAATPYDWGNGAVLYLRGSAYLAADRPTEAAAEFRKMMERLRRDPSHFEPLAQIGLARALSKQGDLAASRTAYQQFLAAWKNADPDLPILVAAKEEYARLK